MLHVHTSVVQIETNSSKDLISHRKLPLFLGNLNLYPIHVNRTNSECKQHALGKW